MKNKGTNTAQLFVVKVAFLEPWNTDFRCCNSNSNDKIIKSWATFKSLLSGFQLSKTVLYAAEFTLFFLYGTHHFIYVLEILFIWDFSSYNKIWLKNHLNVPHQRQQLPPCARPSARADQIECVLDGENSE